MKEPAPRPLFFLLLFSGLVLVAILVMQPLEVIHFHQYISVLFPKGIVALKERNLLFLLQGLMLLVVIPVYILTFVFSWKYRASNKKAKYDPDLVDHRIAEYFWWGIPFVITTIICVITWVKTYELDPFKPLDSTKKPMKIQVVALQWRWLFIYPEEKIASMNFLQIPVGTPILFEITADAPMNSFWIPHLGGQIYAMPKMKSELNLIADEPGDFRGSSANISGEGFSDMHFITRASSPEEYQKWVASAQQSDQSLEFADYEKLAAPSMDGQTVVYQLQDGDLFNRVLMKFMHPKAP
jgi:cytochrome o ubiquinol oxidase subunit 2